MTEGTCIAALHAQWRSASRRGGRVIGGIGGAHRAVETTPSDSDATGSDSARDLELAMESAGAIWHDRRVS